MTTSADAPAELFTNRSDREFTYSPRTVSGREDWVLIDANPDSMIATLNIGSWQVVYDDLPRWVSSAVVRDNQLILIGNEKGQFYMAVKPL